MRRFAALLAGGIAGVGAPVSASAQAPPTPSSATGPSAQDKAAATALFDSGKGLLAEGKIPEACRKLEESRRLDPLPGTILNLAACHEREGRTASAAAEFREARALAVRDQRGDRVAFADDHLRALEPRISTLVIVVPPEADRGDLSVTRDGVALGRAAWGVAMPVDPGAHVVVASAPGRIARRIDVRVGANADAQTATVTALETDPTPPPAPAVVVSVPVQAPAQAKTAAPSGHGLSVRRRWAVVAGGVGLGAAGLGTFFGLLAFQRHGAQGSSCTTSPCSPTSVALNGQAGEAADLSTASFVVSLVALGCGAVLWFGDSVAVAPGAASVQAVGRF